MTEGLPTKAGLAVLEYSTGTEQPTREGNIITLPAQSCICECSQHITGTWEYCPSCGFRLERSAVELTLRGELIPLMDDFEQFLCITPDDEFKNGKQVWFGGTDELPFLVRMDYWTKYTLRGGDFYGYIIPSGMLTMVRKWGNTWKRQGDIFAYPLPFSWEDLKWVGDFNKAKGLQLFETKDDPVFETRHNFTGTWACLMLAGLVRPIAEGTIVAPDHTDLVLEGPHVLAQTAHLHNPPKAD